MMNCFCTLFDHRYLDRGLALYESIDRYCDTFQLWVLCMDEACFEILSGMDMENMHLITIRQLEANDPSLKNVKSHRTPVEYYFSCKPSLVCHVFGRCKNAAQIIYLDADIYFFSSPEYIFNEVGEKSVAVTPHRFRTELKSSESYGKYNAGFLLFKRDEVGIACLEWWRQQCIEWCYDIVEENRFADQKYIDRFSALFDGVLSIDSIGVNLAPWNIDDKKITTKNSQLYVNEEKLVFYHFHNLRKVTEMVFDIGCDRYTPVLDDSVRQFLYKPYLKALACKQYRLRSDIEPLLRRNKQVFQSNSEYQGTVVGRFIKKLNRMLTVAKGLRSGKYMFVAKACP